MLATLSSKGQITIPVSLRNKLNLKTGDAVDFIQIKDESIELIPVRTPVQALKGIIDKPERAITLAEMDNAIGRGG
jgi:antitoxin PrlF